MQFPNLRTYMAAVSDLKNINIPFFQSKSMQIYLNRRGIPYMSVGGFGVVFRFKDKQGSQFAVKCFTSHAPNRAERYKALHDTLQITRFPFMVDFQYVEDGIRVGNQNYPVVVMEWGRGLSLDAAISADLENDGMLQSAPVFAGSLFRLVKTLQEWKMSHGDLQEGNLLVDDDNRLTLIDYDGMFVPALQGQDANEIGLANYQHPKRKNEHFGPQLDDFALLSILFQLSTIEPDNWQTHHNDRQLILSEADYKKPAKSKLIQGGLNSKTAHVRRLAKLLIEACGKNPLSIGAVEKIQQDSAILDWLEIPPEDTQTRSYASIIADVLSLSESQVESFEAKTAEIPAIVTSSSAGDKPRVSEDGNWGLVSNIKNGLIDLFFEDDSGSIKSANNPRSGILSKLKSKVVDLLYEPDAESLPSGSSAVSSPADPPAASSETLVNSEPEMTENPANTEKDRKTAKKPEWMKQRRRK